MVCSRILHHPLSHPISLCEATRKSSVGHSGPVYLSLRFYPALLSPLETLRCSVVTGTDLSLGAPHCIPGSRIPESESYNDVE